MRKVTINFIFTMLISILALILAVSLCKTASSAESELENVKSDISTSLEDDEIDDVEGYAIIAQGIGYGFGALAYGLLLIVAVMIGLYGGVLLLFSIIARVVYATTPKRLLAYRILMSINFALLIGLVFFLGSMLTTTFSLPVLIIMLLYGSVILYCGINTYSKRILT